MDEGAFTGTVLHQRQFDIEHAFTYRVWMSLSRLPESRLPRLIRPRASKYISVARLSRMIGFDLRDGDQQVWLLTQPSLIGRSFNPVSFYFVRDGAELRAIVAHITNTPWDEDHCYVLERRDGDTWVFDKDFHVSPFMPMALAYQWRFTLTDADIRIHMQLLKEGQRIFTAALNLQPTAPSRWLGLKLRLRYPAQNLLTLARIYWQAGLLKLKGAHFYAHPDEAPSVPSRISNQPIDAG